MNTLDFGVPIRPELFQELRRVSREFQHRLAESSKAYQETQRQLAASLEGLLCAIESLKPALAELPFIQAALGAEGWYLSTAFSIPAVPYLLAAVREQRLDDIEDFMVEFARTRISPTLDAVSDLWPHRRSIVSDAIAAHQEGRFALSIPVLLAQADGICHEILGVSLFSKKKGRPVTKAAYALKVPMREADGNPIAAFRRRPLELLTSLNVDTDGAAGKLNRHAVLHGLSVEYASEANSLRAIMVLDYLSDLQSTLSKVVSELEPETGAVV